MWGLNEIFTIVSKLIINVLWNPIEIPYTVAIIQKTVNQSKISFVIVQNLCTEM